MKILTTKKILSHLLMMGLASITAACTNLPREFSCGLTEHELSTIPNINVLWSKDNLYVFDNPHAPLVRAVTNHVFVQAIDSDFSNLNMYAYETITGSELWKRKNGTFSTFVVNGNTLTEGQSGKLVMYNSFTGTISDEVKFPNLDNILYLYETTDSIFGYSNSGRLYIVEKNSGELFSKEPDLIRVTFLQEDGVAYVDDPDGFKAIDIETGREQWKASLKTGFSMGPSFIGKRILILVDIAPKTSNLYAIDKTTGEITWVNKSNIISNVDFQDEEVYFLTVDGNLVILDLNTGEEVQRVTISSQPFVLPDPEIEALIGAYSVAVDPKNNVVIISLGDSCQLAAFQINQD